MSFLTYLKHLLNRAYATFTSPSEAYTGPLLRPDEPTAPFTNFPLGTEVDGTFTLPDGRILGYAQYGSPTGRPVIVCHGIPGSRLVGAFFDEKAHQLNIRIIAPDRPWHGLSSPHPSRKLLDHAKDIEHLADHLKIKEYSVLGISGGGPYALACAFAIPRERLKCVAMICALGPPDIGMKGAQLLHRVAFPYGFRSSPYWVAGLFWRTQPEGRMDLTAEERYQLLLKRAHKVKSTMPAKDRPIFLNKEFMRFTVRSNDEAFAQGVQGWMQDGKILCNDFGFRVEDIRHDLSIHLWYGKKDVFVPPVHGEQLAVRFGGRAYLRFEDETHASMEVNYMEEYLTKVVENL